jgi:hypothetical protein
MLEDLGNLGDFIGGLAVVVTLLYLAVQLRQNTAQLRESSTLAKVQAGDIAFRSFSDWRAKIVCHADVADIYARGLRDLGALQSAERLRFHLLASELFYILFTSVRRIEALSGNDMEVAIANLNIEASLRSPGIVEWWRLNRHDYPEDFASLIDGHVRAAAPEAG